MFKENCEFVQKIENRKPVEVVRLTKRDIIKFVLNEGSSQQICFSKSAKKEKGLLNV